MKIEKIYKVLDEREKVELCQRCNGHGWNWSNLDFGDIPGDEKQIDCGACNGTGRVKTIKVEADIVVPIDWQNG